MGILVLVAAVLLLLVMLVWATVPGNGEPDLSELFADARVHQDRTGQGSTN